MILTLLYYYHHSNGWWILVIPAVIILWFLIKLILAFLLNGVSALHNNLGKIFGGFASVIGAIIGIFLLLLRLVCSAVIFFIIAGGCAGLLYLIGHQIAYWAEGVGIVLGMGIGLWLFLKSSRRVNDWLDKIFPL